VPPSGSEAACIKTWCARVDTTGSGGCQKS
jgi:hypothetical protein